ncbi:hypothetical protein [Tomitella biformata]|uniref:hypothetical protein n=1 Tax=Tomitella biformata TaxID=630403 RepID=UPI000462F22B|nr:hypothetical protein [Tomitella biformata]
MQSSSSHAPAPLATPLARRFSRRTALRNSGLGLGLGLAAVTGSAALGGCTIGTNEPSAPDPLIAMAAAARADAETATQLSVQLPDQAPALTTVAAERAAHADALETELVRANGPTTPAPEPDPGQTQSPPSPPPTLDGLRTALANAQRGAADAARTDSGYRAGLAGSISAACAAQNEVLLP